MINVVNSASSDTFGNAIFYPLIKFCLWLLPFSNVIPFMVPSLLFIIRFTASSAFSLSKHDSKYGLIAQMKLFPGMAPSYNCFNPFTISANALLPNSLKPLYAFICLNIAFTSLFIYVCVSFSPYCSFLSTSNWSWLFLTPPCFLVRTGIYLFYYCAWIFSSRPIQELHLFIFWYAVVFAIFLYPDFYIFLLIIFPYTSLIMLSISS